MDRAAAFISFALKDERAKQRKFQNILKHAQGESRGHGAEAGERVRRVSTVPKETTKKKGMGPLGFEPRTFRLSGERADQAAPRAPVIFALVHLLKF